MRLPWPQIHKLLFLCYNKSMNDKLLEGLPFAEEDKECGYFKDIPVCENYITAFHWKEDWENIENKEDYEQKAYTALLEYGLIREGRYFYQSQCGNCRKCTPIRLIPEHFKPSKSQKAVLKKNQDIDTAQAYRFRR